MTNKGRQKACVNCGSTFTESMSDSNSQWAERRYCSVQCNSSCKSRVTDIFDRLNRYQIKRDGCWGWSGAKDGRGYGVLSSRDTRASLSPEKAHRVSYEKANGPISDGMIICHACDNPECTNPDHLFEGTQADNMRDCSRKGRLNRKSLLNLRPGRKGFRGAASQRRREHG